MSAAYAEPNPGDDTPDRAVPSDGEGAEVVDLSTRTHGHPSPDRADTDPDTDADIAADSDVDVSGPTLVDRPAGRRADGWDVAAWAAGERRPIVPAWLRSWTELSIQVRRLLGFVLHAAAYHLTRLPKYAARIAIRAPHGALKAARVLLRWLFDLGGEPVRQDAVRRVDTDAYLKLTRERDKHVRWRAIVVAAGVLPALGAVAALALVAPGYVQWLATAAVIVGFGVAGQAADRPLLDAAVVSAQVAKLTGAVVEDALASLGIAGITQALRKDPRAITFIAPGIYRDGPGWRAETDLPRGVTATEVMDRREKLSSGLRRPIGCVWPEGRRDIHAARLVVWVADRDASAMPPKVWPLAKTGTVDLFKPFPFGTDPRGRAVAITLMFASMVIGAVPRMGKTFAQRLLLLAAALDVRAELHLYDLMGTGTLSALERVAHRYRCGDEDEDIAYLLDDVRALQAELRRRTQVLRKLPKELCPENKVTPELASRVELGLHPVVVSLDECQCAFTHPQYGKEIAAICEDLVRRGPAVGFIPMFSTQRPSAQSLPTAISANAVLRFCLKVMDQTANDMVLGTSAYKNGIRATMFARTERGVGYLLGEGEDPTIPRTYYIDNPGADRIATRAYALRKRAGRLSGHALGEAPPESAERSSTLLEDILACCPPEEGNGKYQMETITARLADHHPGVYGELGRDALAAALRDRSIPVVQVWAATADGKGSNRRGIDTHTLTRLVTERSQQRGGPDSGDS